jgi:two-component system chemotaxis sensor kinase CheA
MDEIVAVFIQEAREQLGEMEKGLMTLQQGDIAGTPDPELINAIFRAAHTIKGGSGVVEIHVIEHFTHSAENVLDKVRNGDLRLNSALIDDLLAAADHLGALLDAIEQGESGEDAPLAAKGQAIVERLKAYLESGGIGGGGGSVATAAARPPEAATSELESSGGGSVGADTWHISLRFGRDVLKNGMEPVAFLRYLLSLGEIAHITTLFDDMPAAADMDAECCYLGFEINFRSHATKEQIERVFDFVRDECELHILPPHGKLDDYLQLIEDLPEESLRIGEILVRSGALTADELDAALHLQRASQDLPDDVGEDKAEPASIGSILVDQGVIQPELVEAAAVKQKQVSEKKAADARLIRVQADKLDQLIDLVGELVIAGASANLIAQKSGQSTLVEATSVLSRLVESIRDSALQLRMVQIGDTFTRFHRVVRDVSRENGKDIELLISGGETELDKSVVEKIGDPLMHLVRNAIDHGIEAASIRAARGKPAQGRLELNAYHDSGSIVIEVGDDGGGLPKDKILKKAIERGIAQAGDALTDEEIVNLIFQPGFSTADKITNLSGRGVGMDVVRKNIQALRGRVDVQSEQGEGSRFTIRLPLTLAIIDGFLVSAGNASYVIPLDMVVECLELNVGSADRNYLNLRGEVLPFIRLRQLFEVEGEPPKRENVVVVRSAHQKAGIVVDHLLGEFQTVIKPLGTLFRNLRGISGSTILGSGDVALILDVPTLTALAGRKESESFAASAGRH